MSLASHAAALAERVSRLWVVPGQSMWLDISLLEIYIEGLAPAFDGYRIAHFSDVHFDGLMTTRRRLDDLVACINAQQPDLITFTGDLVTHRTAFRETDLIAPLRALEARDGKVAVMGNHDHRAGTEILARVLDEGGFIDLNNAVHTIRRGADCLHVAGVDSLLRHRARLDLVLRQLPDDGTAILLAHEPTFADVSASTERFALQLSGHTHGGQIRIPMLTHLFVAGYSGRRLSGTMLVDRMLLYINRGIGTTGVSLRVNCPPELTVITLKAWNTAKQRDERSGNTTEPAS